MADVVALCPENFKHYVERLDEEAREVDRNEVEILTGRPFVRSLWESIRITPEPYALESDGDLIFLFGLAGVEGGSIRHPWALGTDAVMKYPRLIAEVSKETVANWSEVCQVMTNLVYSENDVAIRWLKWLGFEMLEPYNVGPNDALFLPFLKGVI